MFVNLHFSTRGHTRRQLQARIREQHVAVELDQLKYLWSAGPVARSAIQLDSSVGPTMVIIAANRPPYGPDPSRKRKWVASVRCLVVSIVSWSRTANGRSLRILGQVFSSFCDLPVFTVVKTKKRGKAIYFIYFNRRELSFLPCHRVC